MDPDIALFAHVVAAGSLSAAGRKLGISPAMVSKRIARLEKRLDARLLHRTTRRLELTARGERFHADMTGILAAIRDAEARVADRDAAPAGPLRITAPTSFGRLHIAPYLKPFLDAHPRIELELDLCDAFVDLLGGGIDLAIRIAPEVPSGLQAHRLADSRRVLCAAPAYLAEAGMPATAADLAEHRRLAATGQLPWRLTGPEGQVTVDGPSAVLTNSSEVVRELALSGVGVALRSLWDVSRDLESGRLVRVLGDLEGLVEVGIYAVHPRVPVLAAAPRAFLRHFADLWSPVPPWQA